MEEEEEYARGWIGLLEISKNCCLNLDDEKCVENSLARWTLARWLARSLDGHAKPQTQRNRGLYVEAIVSLTDA